MITASSNSDVNPRTAVMSHLAQNMYPRVIDVGAAMNPWASPHVTHCMDIAPVKGLVSFLGDICAEETWLPVLAEPQFDFSICSHTLEDLRNPQLVLKMLPRISKRGYIEIPSKFAELGVFENFAPQDQAACGLSGPYCGYMHHRWIFSVQNGELVLFPKLNFVDKIAALSQWRETQSGLVMHLCMWWETEMPFRTWNNDYLGPNPLAVMDGYRDNLIKGL